MSQPVLGILTLYLNENKRLEERPVYQRMIAASHKLGMEAFVFTPQDVDSDKKQINGMFYNPKKRQWTRQWTSFPHLIFDRCRIQNTYRFRELLRFRARYSHLNFLNRPLRNKWTIYQMLRTNSEIHPYLPETKLYSSANDVHQLMKKEKLVFLKPINGTGGRGILRIEKIKARSVKYDIQGRDHQRRIIRPQRISPSLLSSKLANWNARDRYIVQQGIAIKLPNGRVHDYRLLVQKNGEGNWSYTGCAGRIGPSRSVTSNLHGGGQAVPMMKLLQEWIGDDEKVDSIRLKIEELGIETASFLEEKYGALCELALDLAIDREGHPWILEVNPKPAREVFAQAGEHDIYHQAIVKPIEYALFVYNTKIKVKSKLKSKSRRRRKARVSTLSGLFSLRSIFKKSPL
ncbi:endospore coat-associated protein [Paenibacillus selenitireducens]|uniref:Endospore coat-associated protein n=1 Tax=Paenibacillus selenitireducens TaxID=1324314 RepID=A0A1T2XLY1_9BACL|nr:YheC/YheD family protein [Paenibacillus selenitireducens]OPA80861.1 endospore coat-associated protein [Paenibacillus selenitireducens]